MTILEKYSTGLGETRFRIETASPTRVLSDGEHRNVSLPRGMAVDWLIIDRIEVDAAAGDTLAISMGVMPSEGGEGSDEPGECLDAIVVEQPTGEIGAVALRSPDWMTQRHGIEVIEAFASNELFSTQYRIMRPQKIIVEAAYALTFTPKDKQAALSPWFAVDKALQF